ncbi:DUF4401 domain-containing protein [Desulfovibrio sp. OttesenSCG-928-O18]|nr:DUF4401 domain-containing protein [Desulfovibrio sp. OttesenSCG-928-O18]
MSHDLAPAQDGAPLPEMTRAALARLRDSGVFSAPAWEAAMAFCGFTPGGREWRDYALHLLVLGGALFLSAGVIFFIAWNWADMHRYARSILMAAIVAGTGFGSVFRGPDTTGGQLLLLVCGIGVGPMLAVFGQAYQTGAELWELFRVWTLVLLALAVGGKQAGLWFVTWLAGNVFVMLWLGRSMDSPLEAVGIFSTLPEFVLALALAFIAWESAAWKLRGNTRYAWLESRWLPRLFFFDLMARLTAYLWIEIFSRSSWSDLPTWLLPHWPVLTVLYLIVVGLSWFWHRKRTPDLFMLACVLASTATLLVCLLLKAEFLFDAEIFGLFCWGMLIVGLTAGIGKVLLTLQRKMERDTAGKARVAVAAIHFFSLRRALPSWKALWDFLQRHSLLEVETPLPVAAPPASPWYVRTMLAFGGWVAAVLFLAFTALFLFSTLRIRSHEGVTLLVASLVPLGIAFATLKLEGIFGRNFGFAMALAGTACAGVGIGIIFDGGSLFLFPVAVVLAILCIPLDSAAYRFIAAVVIVCVVPLGIIGLSMDGFAFIGGGRGVSSAFAYLLRGTTLWWVALGIGLAAFLLREREWRKSRAGTVLEPMFYGAFAGMMLYEICALSVRFGVSMGLFPMGAFAVGVGAGAGLIFLAWRLVKARGEQTERALVVSCAFLALPLGYFLPGAALAVFGLAVSRYLGSLVMQGAAGAFLFAYMVYYYYFLGVSLLSKSLFLAGTGAVLLCLAFALRRSRLGLNGAGPGAPGMKTVEGNGHA